MKKEQLLLGFVASVCLVFTGAGCSASVPSDTDVMQNPSDDGAAMAEQLGEEIMMQGDEEKVMESPEVVQMQKEEGNSVIESEESMIGESDTEETIEAQEEQEEKNLEQADIEGVQFSLSGKNFAFSEKELRVKKGDTVTVTFTSESGFHDWVIDEFQAATEQVKAGGTTAVTFVADKAGTFEYYCSVGSHRQLGMVGKLIVE